MTRYVVLALLLMPAVSLADDTAVSSPEAQQHQQKISAHYTGCKPEENVISNAVANPNGLTTWNATCNDKTYSCSTRKVRNNTGISCKQVTP